MLVRPCQPHPPPRHGPGTTAGAVSCAEPRAHAGLQTRCLEEKVSFCSPGCEYEFLGGLRQRPVPREAPAADAPQACDTAVTGRRGQGCGCAQDSCASGRSAPRFAGSAAPLGLRLSSRSSRSRPCRQRQGAAWALAGARSGAGAGSSGGTGTGTTAAGPRSPGETLPPALSTPQARSNGELRRPWDSPAAECSSRPGNEPHSRRPASGGAAAAPWPRPPRPPGSPRARRVAMETAGADTGP